MSQSPLTKLIGDFVNDAKREVEDAYDWNALRETGSLPIVADTFRYVLTDFGPRYRLMRDVLGRFQVFNNTDDMFLQQAPSTRWMSRQLNSTNAPAAPLYFDINGQSGGDPVMDLYPVPDKAYQIYIEAIVPQPDLSNDSDDLHVPHHPVIFGAWARAIAERGEDQGIQSSDAYREYLAALSDAISYSIQNASDELAARVV